MGLGDGRRKRRETLGMVLAGHPSCTTANDSGFLRIAHHGGMDFAHIDADGIGTRRCLGLCPVFDHDMPGVSPCLLIEDQPDFQDTQDIDKRRGQGEGDGTVALARRQRQCGIVFLDGRTLPERGTEPLAPMEECGVGRPAFRAARVTTQAL